MPDSLDSFDVVTVPLGDGPINSGTTTAAQTAASETNHQQARSSPHTGLIIGVTLGVVGLGLFVVGALVVFCRRRRQNSLSRVVSPMPLVAVATTPSVSVTGETLTSAHSIQAFLPRRVPPSAESKLALRTIYPVATTNSTTVTSEVEQLDAPPGYSQSAV